MFLQREDDKRNYSVQRCRRFADNIQTDLWVLYFPGRKCLANAYSSIRMYLHVFFLFSRSGILQRILIKIRKNDAMLLTTEALLARNMRKYLHVLMCNKIFHRPVLLEYSCIMKHFIQYFLLISGCKVCLIEFIIILQDCNFFYEQDT